MTKNGVLAQGFSFALGGVVDAGFPAGALDTGAGAAAGFAAGAGAAGLVAGAGLAEGAAGAAGFLTSTGFVATAGFGAGAAAGLAAGAGVAGLAAGAAAGFAGAAGFATGFAAGAGFTAGTAGTAGFVSSFFSSSFGGGLGRSLSTEYDGTTYTHLELSSFRYLSDPPFTTLPTVATRFVSPAIVT